MDISKNERLASMFGLNMPTVDDIVKREDYKSEAEYLTALADFSSKMEKPEVQRALRRAGRDRIAENDEAIRKEQREEYTKIRQSVKLDSTDEDAINKEAERLAQADLASGRIKYSQLGKAVKEYGDTLTAKRKDEIASMQQFNGLLRKTVRKGTF